MSYQAVSFSSTFFSCSTCNSSKTRLCSWSVGMILLTLLTRPSTWLRELLSTDDRRPTLAATGGRHHRWLLPHAAGGSNSSSMMLRRLCSAATMLLLSLFAGRSMLRAWTLVLLHAHRRHTPTVADGMYKYWRSNGRWGREVKPGKEIIACTFTGTSTLQIY